MSAVSDAADFGGLKSEVGALIRRKRTFAFAAPALILAYLVYVFFAFDVPGLSDRIRLDNGATLLRDAYSYKTHVVRDNRRDEVTVSIEGERKGVYPADAPPEWVTPEGEGAVSVDLGDGGVATLGETVTFTAPGYGPVTATIGARGLETKFPEGPVPDWISVSKTRLSIETDSARLTVTRTKAEVFRYFLGWEMFFFTLDSPFAGRSFGQLVSLAISADRIDPDRSNAGLMLRDFWTNGVWRHNDVAWAMFETVLMAFLGTFGAALIALPLAFLAARNFMPLMALRFVVRRVFDFARGVDALIWTIVLARAFGPGPLTGSLAILLTDTGSFGKLFSEALENVDEKQIEGVRSTGAKPAQRYRFGVIPQVMPVLLSQVLYYLESNTRSATVIGAITGGGIGLLLTQAIITSKDWEEVTYYIILILLTVMAMDTFSGWVRRRLIKGR